MRFKSLWFLLLFTVTASAQGAEIKQAMELTGMDRLVAFLPQLSNQVLEQSRGALEPAQFEQVESLFQTHFSDQALEQAVNAQLQKHYDSKTYQRYVQALNTPLAQKVAALEKSDPQQRYAWIGEQKSKNFTDAPRKTLLEELDKAGYASEFGVELQTAFFRAVFVAVNPQLEADMRIDDEELQRMVNEVYNGLIGPTRESTLWNYYYTFKDQDVSVIKDYLTLQQSNDMQAGNQWLRNAVMTAIEEQSKKMTK